jgi:hypothetical protein
MQNRGFLLPMVDFAPSPSVISQAYAFSYNFTQENECCASILRFMWLLMCTFKCFSHDVVFAEYALRMSTMKITISGTQPCNFRYKGLG